MSNRLSTIPTEFEQCRISGRLDAWKLEWQEGQPNKPHIFWDSDVAKWIEAAAYSLATDPDEELEAKVDTVIDRIALAQQPDGYLNTYFTSVEPDKRWTNLRDRHELYCAGHLIEAAIAYYEATGKRKLLDVLVRYADHICSVFGRGVGQKKGYPGHQEIELALVRLYRATGNRRYLELASYFIDERGTQPHYYDQESLARGESPRTYWARSYRYNQSHLPVREQTEVVGHAVRACYMYAGMAAVATETGDQSLIDACDRLWQNLTEKQMYLTGGIGQTRLNEGFTFDYDLPNETAYTETCASIALILWAHSMFHLNPRSEYYDVIERALYNSVLGGVSLDGKKFFYANPLASYPGISPRRHEGYLHEDEANHYHREDWFDCACCPPNLARLMANLGSYFYSLDGEEIYVHLYSENQAKLDIAGNRVTITQHSDYPWDEMIELDIEPEQPQNFSLKLRIPGWCRGAKVEVNGQNIAMQVVDGYATISRKWSAGDKVRFMVPMPIERIHANPIVRQDVGRVALMRGPLVYCLEEADNGAHLASVVLPHDAVLTAECQPSLLDGTTVIWGNAFRLVSQNSEHLYSAEALHLSPFRFKAIPYFQWANREPGEMCVWILER